MSPLNILPYSMLMKIDKNILTIFKLGLQFKLVQLDYIIDWSNELLNRVSSNTIKTNFFVSNLSNCNIESEALSIIEEQLDSEKVLENELVGFSLVGFISKKYKQNKLSLFDASYENYKIQLHFKNLEFDLEAYDFDVKFQLAKDQITGDFEIEKKRLTDYLNKCELVLEKQLKVEK